MRFFEDSSAAFIGFMDQDGERVLLNLNHIAAFEILDTHFLSEEMLSKLLNDSLDSNETAKAESNG